MSRKTLIIGNLHSNSSSKAFLEKFVRIVSDLTESTIVISCDEPPVNPNVLWVPVKKFKKDNLLQRLVAIFKEQIDLISILLFNKLEYDQAIVLPTSLFIPILILKTKNKRIATFLAQRVENVIFNFFIKLSLFFSNLIIVESYDVLLQWKMDKYKKKSFNGSIYVDTDLFRKVVDLDDRENLIGYVGSLDNRKGTPELMRSIQIINENKQDIKFVIGGKGIYESDLIQFSKIEHNVEYKGLINYNYLPSIYNKIKVFVLPSTSEGLPNVILEAMACGAIILSTPVGAIKDIINDEENGFIMENNLPETISENIFRVLDYKDLFRVQSDSLKIIENHFTYKSALKRYKVILDELS